MKFTDKYPDMKPIDDVCDGIMRGTEMKPCLICNDPTEYIEINYEAHFCSEECVKKMDATYFEECKKRGEFDVRMEEDNKNDAFMKVRK